MFEIYYILSLPAFKYMGWMIEGVVIWGGSVFIYVVFHQDTRSVLDLYGQGCEVQIWSRWNYLELCEQAFRLRYM